MIFRFLSLLFRSWRSLLSLFDGKQRKQEVEIAEKVDLIQHQSIQMVGELSRASIALKRKVSAHDYTLVKKLMQPIREKAENLSDRATQLNCSKKLTELISQSEHLARSTHKWVNLCTKLKKQEEIVQTAVQEAASLMLLRIDRDLKLLERYRNSRINEVGIGILDRQKGRQLSEKLSFQIARLKGLKELPNLSFGELEAWSAQVDRLRNRYVNAALKTIDALCMA